jgi:hypothetical protein
MAKERVTRAKTSAVPAATNYAEHVGRTPVRARDGKQQKYDTSAHIECIADTMARGAWLTGISARQYATEHNVALSTVKNWSSQAHRLVSSATSDERREMVVSTLAKLEVIAARATADNDWRGGVAALALLAKIAGLEAPVQMHVKIVPPDAPDGVRELLSEALDETLPEAQREDAARRVQVATLLHLLSEVDEMEEPMRGELQSQVRAKVEAWR